MFGLARFALFILVAAHLVHVPILAHEEHLRVTEPTSAEYVDGHLAVHADEHATMSRADGPSASLSEPGGSVARLADHGGIDHESMVTAATIPTQAATPDALRLPAEIPAATADGSISPAAAVAHPAGPARRHLVLQVLLR